MAKKTKKKLKKSKSPFQAIIALGYKQLFEDYDNIDPQLITQKIDEEAAMIQVSQWNFDFSYRRNHIPSHCRWLRKNISFIPDKDARRKIWNEINKPTPNLIMFTSEASLRLYRNILLNNNLNTGETSLSEEDVSQLLKAYTYYNQQWTDEQMKGMDLTDPNVLDISLSVDLPESENKLAKDFKAQLYKCFQLFIFLENSGSIGQSYIDAFCHALKIKSWKDFIVAWFFIFEKLLKSPVFKIDELDFIQRQLVNRFSISKQPEDRKDIEDPKLWKSYFRNHFFYPLHDDKVVLLDIDLFNDKFYQGLKFDIFNAAKKIGLKDCNGKKISKFEDFTTAWGDMSEIFLLRDLILKSFMPIADKILMPKDFKNIEITGEPDAYVRMGENLLLFEYKDVILADRYKYINNVEETKKVLMEKICLHQPDKRKGVGQLIWNIDRILNHNLVETLDPEIKKVSRIIPIVLTTDVAFTALGVNLFVAQKMNEFLKEYDFTNHDVFISLPLLCDIDTFISLSYFIASKKINLVNVVTKYLNDNMGNLASFSSYCKDILQVDIAFSPEMNSFLFKEHFRSLK